MPGSRFELIADVASRGAELDVSSAWLQTDCTFSADVTTGPDARLTVDNMIYVDSQPSIEQRIQLPSGTLADMSVVLGMYAGIEAGQPTTGAFVEVYDPSTAQVGSFALTLAESLTLQRFSWTFSDNLSDVEFYVRISGVPNQSSGDFMQLNRAHTYFVPNSGDLIDGGLQVILPEFDYTQQDRKIENVHRTRAGGRFVYKWGDYFIAKFSVRYVSSEQHAIVNSWWSENTQLLWMVDTGAIVESVQIVNRQLPIGEFILPHNDLYQGAIELETY